MVDVAKVSVFDIPVGIFNWDDRYGVARFEYDQSFIGRGLEPSPLMMPVREGRVYSFANLVLHGFAQVKAFKNHQILSNVCKIGKNLMVPRWQF